MLTLRLLLLSTAATFSTFSVAQTDRNQMYSTIEIQYGVVDNVSRVKLKSNAGGNMLVGGMLGAATSGHKDRNKHALEGAAAAGLLTAIVEGSKKAYAYEVQENNGRRIKVITEHGGIAKGDCVSVENGKTTNIKRVSSVYCEDHEHEALEHPHVKAKAVTEASECQMAKQIALDAKTDKELDMAMKKVRIFCGN